MLYLIPTPLAEGSAPQVLPPQVVAAVARLPYFLVENLRTARRFVKEVAPHRVIEDIRFVLIDKDSTPAQVKAALEPLVKDKIEGGVLSEAGCPGIADPGAALAQEAHRLGLAVRPLVGPSSILLALMGSGLNGQRFAFHGYLPIEKAARIAAIKSLDKESAQRDQAQLCIETPYRNDQLLADLLLHLSPGTRLCIETPYRNDQLLADLLLHLSPGTRLCIAADLTAPTEYLRTLPVATWRQLPQLPALHKRPTVFAWGK